MQAMIDSRIRYLSVCVIREVVSSLYFRPLNKSKLFCDYLK